MPSESKWMPENRPNSPARKPLYTAAERARRLALVLRYLATGEGYWAATLSILAKTATLYLIMITGAIWEKVVFGQYLLAPAFFWEDVFSFAVIALHSAYILALWTGFLTPEGLMILALAAYAAYAINAAQFVLKLRLARLDAAVTE